MEHLLTNQEIRLLGSDRKRDGTTPEYYPLSMNALVNACNQKSNRAPVAAWDEETVFRAIESLEEKELVFQTNLNRVPRFDLTKAAIIGL